MKNVQRLWLILLATSGLFTSQLANGQVGQIIWEENFNSLNTSTWNYVLGNGCDLGVNMCGWGNFELEYYRQENVSIQNIAGESGNKGLYIQAKREDFGGSKFTSGKLNTAKKLAVKYGVIEVRMKTPKVAVGLWPAFWLLGTSIETDTWPKCGEIDMMEMGHKAEEITRQQYPGVSPNKYVGSNLIWYEQTAIAPGNETGAASIASDKWYCTPYVSPTDLDDRFIVYRMYWDDKSIRFSTEDNGIEHDMYTGEFPISPATSVFQRPFYFLVNLAVGGSFTDASNDAQVTAALPSSMIIDYIRVRQWNGKGEVYDDTKVVANAGADKTVASGAISSLDASSSYGAISSYIWKEDGSQIATGKTASVNLADGIHTITLTVTDVNGTSSTDDIVYTVGNSSDIGEVIFEEQFNTVDANKWNYTTGNGCELPSGCGFGNWELQYYNQDNVYVAPISGEPGNNALVLEAKIESMGGSSFTSGKITSQNKVAVKYGLIEFRMKSPKVETGLWPAVWMLGINHPTTGWPKCGEVDMMEMGQKSASRVTSSEGWVGSANEFTAANVIWYSPKAVSVDNPLGAASIAYDHWYIQPYHNGGDLSTKFVTYRCYWTNSQIRLTIIDNSVEYDLYTGPFPIDNTTEAFRQPFFLIANLAVGGTFTDASTPAQVTAPMPAKMYIDYIKVMKYKGQGEIIQGETMIAIAGADVAVVDTDKNGKESITLDASASYGNITSYEWFINGTRFATGAKPTIELPVGDYLVTLKTLDSQGNVATDEQAVEIREIVWEDNFNSFNSSIWNVDLGNGCDKGPGMCGWGNQELQSYQPGNLTIEPIAGEAGNNALVITAKSEVSPDGSAFTSGKINSSNNLVIKYGLVEVRLKAPAVETGLWPAAWLLGANSATAGWPTCGEMDMMEMGHKAAERLKQGANATVSANRYVGSNAIWYAADAVSAENPTGAASIAFDQNYNQPYVSAVDKPLNDRYVTYRLYWTENQIRYTIVDQGFEFDLYTGPFTLSGAQPAFKKPFYFLLNLAVGGNFTDATAAGQVTAPIPAKMYVDYVRVLKYKGYGSVAFGNGLSAKAGADAIVTDSDADGSANFILDGSQSSTFKEGNTITNYSWTINGSQIATGTIPTVSLSYGSHIITLTISDNEGNSATDEVIVVITNGVYTDVEKVVASQRELIIYPSPVTDVLNISIPEGNVDRIELYNLSGAKVLDIKDVTQIDMSLLPKGLYVVVVTIEGELLVKKVIKN